MEQQNTTPRPTIVDDVKPPVNETLQVSPDVMANAHEPVQTETIVASDVRQAPQEETALAETSSETENPIPTQKSESTSKRPLMTVIAAVLVGVGLAGLSVFVYMATNKTADPVVSSESPNAPAGNTSAAIDETTQEIDKAMQTIDAESDFSEADLTEEALEL